VDLESADLEWLNSFRHWSSLGEDWSRARESEENGEDCGHAHCHSL
jgi:hypothetical protein